MMFQYFPARFQETYDGGATAKVNNKEVKLHTF
jgi:hypothetical protein